jgi:AcrR family transcriptional regulator
MPRVSPEYLATRRIEILAAAARRFARDGFHSTSMAEVIQESGLSAGAVYRYFRSKEDIIAGVAELVLSRADEVFGDLLADDATPSPVEAVSTAVNGLLHTDRVAPVDSEDLPRIALQIWSEALRNPAVQQQAGGAYRRLRDHFAEVARRWQAAGHLDPDAVPDQVGAALLGLAQGFLLQHLLVTGTTAPDYLAGVESLLAQH